MAGKCERCGKTPGFGHNVSHAKNRTNRMWMPNIQHKTMMVNGEATKVNICTRCLKTLAKTSR